MNDNTKQLYEMKAQIIQAAGHPLRLAIIDALSACEYCVYEIADKIEAQRPNVSRHLAIMLKAGLLKTRKDGLNTYYSLKTPCITKFLSCIDEVAKDNAAEAAKILNSM